MDLFEQFSFMGFEAAAPEETKKEEKKAEKKEEKKTKDSSSSKESTVSVVLPCKVRGNNVNTVLDGEGSISLKEAANRLISLGIVELNCSQVGLAYVNGILILGFTGTNMSGIISDDDLNVKMPVTIAAGEKRCTFTPLDFPNKDEDEISVEMISKKFSEINPEYKGCSMIVDGQYATPVMFTALGEDKELSEGSVIYMGGEELTITETVTVKDFLTTHFGEDMLKKRAKVKIGLYYSFVDEQKYFVQVTGTTATGVKATSEVKKAVMKYHLPLEVWLSNKGEMQSLTPEFFGGKEKVSIDEIWKFYEESEPLLFNPSRAKNRQANFYEDRNRLSLSTSSGTKG